MFCNLWYTVQVKYPLILLEAYMLDPVGFQTGLFDCAEKLLTVGYMYSKI